MSGRLEASRMSSVFGLNASPQSAMTLPLKVAPKCLLIRANKTCFWR
jgi:hypothetical protein